jgi:mercuric ion transport protein
MTGPQQPAPDQRQPPTHRPAGWSGVGAVLLAVVCCALPAMIAAGALSALGAWLANPWLLGTTGLLLLAGLAVAWRRRHPGHARVDRRTDRAV